MCVFVQSKEKWQRKLQKVLKLLNLGEGSFLCYFCHFSLSLKLYQNRKLLEEKNKFSKSSSFQHTQSPKFFNIYLMIFFIVIL